MTVAAQKAYRGIGMEGSVARWYDKTTRKDFPEYRKLAERLRASLPEGGEVLEVAPGPGFVSIEVARDPRYRVTGLDISNTFARLPGKTRPRRGCGWSSGKERVADAVCREQLRSAGVQGRIQELLRPETALKEMYRVLRPGGKGVVIDLRRDAPMSEIRRYVKGLDISCWNRWFMLLTFRVMLLKRAYTRLELEKMMEGIGFRKAEVRINELGMEAWFEK